MATIYVIRHCESEGNACRRAQAQFDGLVTRKGYLQNECLRKRFEGIHLDAIYASDTFRSVMTATPIAQERNLPIHTRMLLREITTGVWEDLAWGDIPNLYPAEYEVWDKCPWNLITPGGTTFQQVAQRGIEAMRRIAREVGPAGTALAVTHSCTIKAMLCVLAGAPMSEVRTYGHGDNTSVNVLEVDKDGNITVGVISDSDHLPENLRRAWSGVAGQDINMAFEVPHLDNDGDAADYLRFAQQYACEHGQSFDKEQSLREAARVQAVQPAAIAFSLLRGKRSGLVMLDEPANLPDSCGVLYRHVMLPELQGKGYSDQLLGYAIHIFRHRGKHGLAIPLPVTQEDKTVANRFIVSAMEGHDDYLYLNMDVPSLPTPTLA